MGQKVHPIGFRLGLNQRHQSEWFHSLRNFPSLLLEEKIIRDGLAKQYKEAGIEKVRITRDHQQHISLNIYALWHEKLLDDSNNELQTLRTFVQGVIKSPLVSITLEPTDTTHARLVAMSIAAEVEQRKPFRRAMKNALKDLMSKNVDGAKIQISGRLNGAEIARSESIRAGRVPLHTLRAKIDYCTYEAHTIYGILGIKVWLFRNEILTKR